MAGNAAKLFSHSQLYRIARPTYDPSIYKVIFDFIAETPSAKHTLAVDVACGTGQVASELSKHYDHVIACDANAEQLRAAIQGPNITYIQSLAEDIGSSLASVVSAPTPPERQTVDLATVAQALHWFDIDTFYRQVRQVLTPNTGVLACWGYSMLRIVNLQGPQTIAQTTALQQANGRFNAIHADTLGAWWDGRRVLVDSEYEGLDEAARRVFSTVKTVRFLPRKEMSLGQIVTYMRSWSSYQTYMKQEEEEKKQGLDPVQEFEDFMIELFGCGGGGGGRGVGGRKTADEIVFTTETPHFLILAR